MPLPVRLRVGCRRGPRVLAAALFLAVTLCGGLAAGQTVLLTESFETGGTMPPGWSVEALVGPNIISFVTTSTAPSGFTAPDGSYFVQFRSYFSSSGQNRLRRTTGTSTVGYGSVVVNLQWLYSSGYSAQEDLVHVEWSPNGTDWTIAATIPRYSATQGWQQRSVSLPSAAEGLATLFVGFRFVAAFGNNCFLDHVRITAAPVVPAIPGGWPWMVLACVLLAGGMTGLRLRRGRSTQ